MTMAGEVLRCVGVPCFCLITPCTRSTSRHDWQHIYAFDERISAVDQAVVVAHGDWAPVTGVVHKSPQLQQLPNPTQPQNKNVGGLTALQ